MQLSGFTFLHWKTSAHRSGLSRLFIPFAEFWVDRKDFKWTLDASVHVKTTCWQLFLLCYLNKAFTLRLPAGPVDKNPPVSAGYTDSTPGPGTAHLPQRRPWSRAVLGTYRVAPALHRYSKPTHSNGDPVQTKMFTLSTILSKCAFCNGSVF